jgi:PhzF family phenazine biosynthesis protein
MENNLSETGFYVRGTAGFEIRWFTPRAEVDLCGHATLAAAHVLFRHEGYPKEEIAFSSRSGILNVRRKQDLLVLDFPLDQTSRSVPPPGLVEALGAKPVEVLKGKTDLMLVYSTQQHIESMQPDLAVLAKFPFRGVIVTAKGDSVDFVSRFFAPGVGVPEDPVTGSAHTTLTPYWVNKLRKRELTALQLSMRGGRLWCSLVGDRVEIGGKAHTYLIGEAFVEANGA